MNYAKLRWQYTTWKSIRVLIIFYFSFQFIYIVDARNSILFCFCKKVDLLTWFSLTWMYVNPSFQTSSHSEEKWWMKIQLKTQIIKWQGILCITLLLLPFACFKNIFYNKSYLMKLFCFTSNFLILLGISESTVLLNWQFKIDSMMMNNRFTLNLWSIWFISLAIRCDESISRWMNSCIYIGWLNWC